MKCPMTFGNPCADADEEFRDRLRAKVVEP